MTAEAPLPGERGGAGAPQADTQALRYAEELHRLRRVERAQRDEIESARQQLAESRAQQLAILADLKQALQAEQRRGRELQAASVSAIKALALAIEARDGHTGGHSERVRAYSLALGERLGLDREALNRLEISAVLHDLGNLGVPDAVLAKTAALTDDEWRLLRQHPTVGAGIVRAVPSLAAATGAVLSHHERWDGNGYPQGLRGEAIPLEGRIIAVADAFDAMIASRAYRGGLGIGAAVQEITRCSGSHFEPRIVDAFLEAWQARRIP